MVAVSATDNNLEPIVKIAISTLMSIISLQPAANAFADVTGDDYRNPDFVPTQAVADGVAALLDREYSQITPIGKETPLFMVQTPESYMEECNRSHARCAAAKDAFRVMGLDIPGVWSELS